MNGDKCEPDRKKKAKINSDSTSSSFSENESATESGQREDHSFNNDRRNFHKLKVLMNKLSNGKVKDSKEIQEKLENVMGKEAVTRLRALMIKFFSQDAQQAESNLPVKQTTYTAIDPHCRIIRGLWHQADADIFNSKYAGRQCCVMAMSSIVKSVIIPPSEWSTDIINQNLIEGNAIYKTIQLLSDHQGIGIPASGYLFVKNFDVVRSDLKMFDATFDLLYENDPLIFGSLSDEKNQGPVGVTLLHGLCQLFESHSAGILIANDRSFAVVESGGKFYFCDSHACDESGKGTSGAGSACVIECDTIEHLNVICKEATGSENREFTIDYVDVVVKSLNDSDVE